MLELRPTCENCNKALPPDSLEARICSYECTFCASCVENVLGEVKHRPVDPAAHAKFSAPIKEVPPEQR
jgi:uncharacterized protein